MNFKIEREVIDVANMSFLSITIALLMENSDFSKNGFTLLMILIISSILVSFVHLVINQLNFIPHESSKIIIVFYVVLDLVILILGIIKNKLISNTLLFNFLSSEFLFYLSIVLATLFNLMGYFYSKIEK